MTKTSYPEIESAGGLIQALDLALQKLDSPLRVSANDQKFFPGAYARIEKANKFSQIYLAADQKLYLPDFWRDGVCLAHGKIEDINLLVSCIDFWLSKSENTKQLAETYSFVTLSDVAEIYDDGKEVEYTWKFIQKDSNKRELKPFVDLAIKDEVLSKLFPYTSLMTLCFSRCTGHPFTDDTPTVTPIYESDEFLVRKTNGDVIGTGSAFEALTMVRDNLPKDIGPAVRGTLGNR